MGGGGQGEDRGSRRIGRQVGDKGIGGRTGVDR